MQSKLVIAILAVVATIMAGVVIFMLVKPSLPQEFSTIPGFVGAKLVSGDNFNKVYDLTITDKGNEIHCGLNLKVDAYGSLILPGKDDIFTTVLAQDPGYSLFDDSGKLGEIPGIFITKNDEKQNFHVLKPGADPIPVEIDPGKINNLKFGFDTIIKGPEGMEISVTSNGSEIASGKLPLKLNLGKIKATAKIDGLFASQMLSSGLFHIFNGSQQVSAGTNTIRPAAQTVGNSIWFHKGKFVSLNDGICIISDSKKTYYSIDNKDYSIDTPGIDVSKGAVLIGNGSLFWVNINGMVMISQKGKPSKPTSIHAQNQLDKSGQYLIVGKQAYDTAIKPVNPLPGWQWTLDGCFMKMDNGFLVCTGKANWKAEADITVDAVCKIISKGKAFFTSGNKVTKPFEILTGQTENISGIVLEGAGEINFPDGTTIMGNIQTNVDGKSIWQRTGWSLEKSGTSGVLCFNAKTSEHELINAQDGLKAIFWNGGDVISINHFDIDWLVFSLDGYVISVKRLEIDQ